MKSIYNMGYFDPEHMSVEATDSPKGKIVTFKVKEKPTIKYIEFKGNNAIKTEKLEKNVDIHTGSILNIFNIRKNIQRIELQYQEKNYYSAKVSYETQEVGNNQVRLIFKIKEGEKVRIKSIKIVGNTAYSTKALKKLMKTSEKGFFSWLTSSGEYKKDMLDRDVAVLEAHYQNNGYIQVRVADPEIVTKGNWIYITIKLEEGPRYKMGKVDIAGDLIVSKEELLKKLQSPKEEYYDRDALRKDILALTDFYSDYGYASADADPRIRQHEDEKRVDVTFNITKGKPVYFERINISGNTKTRDKVIRRELKITEQGLYSGADLKKSVKNLNRLNFFEDVKVNDYKGSEDNTKIMKFDVKEKATGNFTFGAGYSSIEHVFFTSSISKSNLFGNGQALSVQAQVGSTTTQIMFNYVEPWLFDIPLTTSFSVYNWIQNYDYYDKESVGGSISASYPFFQEDLRLFGSYAYDRGTLSNISSDASSTISNLTGTNITSSITVGATYDTRDKIVNPTSGQNHLFSIEYAGLGGNIGFTKFTAEVGWYIPLFWRFVGFIHGVGGYIVENPDKLLPDYERYYLGGINSIRGFDWRGVHLYDSNGAVVGGREMIQGNFELQLPIVPSAGVLALLFFDTGQVFDSNFYRDRIDTGATDANGYEIYTGVNPAGFDLSQLRQTVGGGIRWESPMGPIRIEYGYILNKKATDNTSAFEFSMGAAF